MSSSRQQSTRRKPESSCRKLRLIYRRPGWLLGTAARYRYFDSLADALGYVRRLNAWRRAQPGLCARLEIRDGGRWKELPIVDEVSR